MYASFIKNMSEDLKDLVLRYLENSTSLQRHFKLYIEVNQEDRKHHKKGHKQLTSDRYNRKIMRCLHDLRDTVANFTGA